MKETDLQLLRQLYAIHSPTGGEWPLICFIREYVATHIPEAKVRIDRMGNLYIIKGVAGDGYPTLVCHLDQVQALHSDDFEVKLDEDMLYGWSEQNQQREGLGADDKNGIFICLRCLEDCPRLKVFMAVGEEKGCIGTNRCDLSFFADSLYVLEPDCKGGEEIHTNLRGIPCASPDFEQALEAEANGLTITDGKTSDILTLTLSGIGVSCANIPAGYHLPHKDDEYTILSELDHTLAYVRHLVQTLYRRYPHEYKSDTQRQAEKEISMTDKPILYFDMDNVLVDFQSGLEHVSEEEKAKYADDGKGKPHYDDIPGLFSLMKPMPGAIDAVKALAEKYDCYILSTAPWNNPTALQDKLDWIKRYFPQVFHKRVIFTHQKNLCLQPGTYLIDDRTAHGASQFGDRHIQFGTEKFPNWQSVVEYLKSK
jgi:5'(3')-deoxyribonucleotidase